jgi:hypothetical protein
MQTIAFRLLNISKRVPARLAATRRGAFFAAMKARGVSQGAQTFSPQRDTEDTKERQIFSPQEKQRKQRRQRNKTLLFAFFVFFAAIFLSEFFCEFCVFLWRNFVALANATGYKICGPFDF